MSGIVDDAGAWLSRLHDVAGPRVCPGDWWWTTAAAGAVLAVAPVLAATVVALLRRRTGNRYSAGTTAVVALAGVLGTAVLPLVGFTAVSGVFRSARLGTGSSGLSDTDLADLEQSYCFLRPQVQYLGGDRSVGAALGALPGPDLLVAGRVLALLVAAPAAAFVATWVLARLAVRRGPAWPGRLLWLPFLGLLVGTLALGEGPVGQLWLGYVPAAAAGSALLLAVGRPSWRAISAAERDPDDRPRDRPDGGGGAAPERAPARPVERAPGRAHAVPATEPRPEPVPPPPRAAAAPPPAGPRTAAPSRPLRAHPVGSARSGTPPATRVLPPEAQPGRGRSAADPPRAGSAPLAAAPGPLPPELAAALGVPAAPGRPAAPSGRFTKLARLGEGGFGQVWLARDTVLDREVAVKVARAPDAETEQRIRREARALAAVHHPHCVQIYDIVNEFDGVPGLAIVMEHVRGRPLPQEVAEAGPLSDTAGAHLWLTVAGALAAAHSHGVLHRDVKPANIIVDGGGRAHLIDFGISRSSGDPTLTATGIVIGTPDYLAPEVAAGEPATPAADAWQLAAAVSYALTGAPPRGRRADPVSALAAAANAEPLTHLPERSAHRDLLGRALHTDPARRPSLAAVQAELARWLDRTGRPSDGPVTMRLSAVRRPGPAGGG